jgi:hypothetical protein
MKKIQIYAAIIVIVSGVAFAFIRHYNLPKRVDEVETNVDKVAVTFDKYMMEQRVRQIGEDKREEMMWELIKEK